MIDGTRARAPKVDLMFHNILQCHNRTVNPQEEVRVSYVSSPADHRNYDGSTEKSCKIYQFGPICIPSTIGLV